MPRRTGVDPVTSRPWPSFRWSPTDLWPVVLSSFGLSFLAGRILAEAFGLEGPGGTLVLVLLRQASLVVPVAWWLRRRGHPFARSVGLARVPVGEVIVGFAVGLGVFLVSYAIGEVTAHAIQAVLGRPAQGRNFLAEFPGGWGWAFSAVAILVAPFAEEILFRGVLFQGLRSRHRLLIAVLVSAAMFAATHAELSRLPDLLFSGAVYALLAERTRSLAAPIAAHMASNVLAAILTFA